MVGVLLATMVLAGCGNDAEGLTATEFREQANAICARGNQEIGEAAGPVFGNDAATPDERRAALDAIVSLTNRDLDEIEALTAPSDMKDDVAAMIAEGRSATDTAKAQGLDYWTTDADPWVRTQELALALGLDACSGG